MRPQRALTLDTFAADIETADPDPKRLTDPKRTVKDTGGLIGVDDRKPDSRRTPADTTGTDVLEFRGRGFGMRATACDVCPDAVIIGIYTDHTFTQPVDGARSFAIGPAADMVPVWTERERGQL